MHPAQQRPFRLWVLLKKEAEKKDENEEAAGDDASVCVDVRPIQIPPA